jgi:hypothetical protein
VLAHTAAAAVALVAIISRVVVVACLLYRYCYNCQATATATPVLA